MERSSEGGGHDHVAARSLIDSNLFLGRALLMSDNPEVAREVHGELAALLREMRGIWPDDDSFASQTRDAEILHEAILKELGRLD